MTCKSTSAGAVQLGSRTVGIGRRGPALRRSRVLENSVEQCARIVRRRIFHSRSTPQVTDQGLPGVHKGMLRVATETGPAVRLELIAHLDC